MGEINYLAVLAAAMSSFVIGGLWYSPVLFQNVWMRANKFTPEDVAEGNVAMIFGLSFLFALLMAFNLAMFLADPGTTALWGATAGGLAGFGWAALMIATVALFERRPSGYILVNGGYATVSLTVMGLILGAWR